MPSFVRVGCGLVVRSGGFLSRKWMSRKPQPACGDKRLYSAVPPPRSFIAAAMNLTVMRPAQRHGELIAHLATERSRLCKTQMMGIRRTPTTNQAGLFDDMPDMVAVTNPAWFRKYQDTLVNLWWLLGKALIIEPGSNVVSFCAFWRDHCEFGGERFLHLPGIGCGQLVFCYQPSPRPQRGFISRVEAFDLTEQLDS